MIIKYKVKVTFGDRICLTECPFGGPGRVHTDSCSKCNFYEGKKLFGNAIGCSYPRFHKPKTWEHLLGKTCSGKRVDDDHLIAGRLCQNLKRQPFIHETGLQLAMVYPHSLEEIELEK